MTDTSLCAWCRTPLDQHAASSYFCGQRCQTWWHTSLIGHAVPPEAVAILVVVRARPALDEIAASFRQLGEAAKAFAAAGVLEPPPPADPMARALHLRRTRNTGPTTHQRAPARINPTRTRR